MTSISFRAIDLSIASLAFAVLVTVSTEVNAQTKWDLSVPWGPGVFHTRNAIKFAERVDQATKGEVKITVHPGAALGIKGPETLRAIRSGIVPMAEGAMLTMVGDEPILGFDSLPFLVENYKELKTLHELTRPLYEAAIARQNAVALYMVPWEPTNIFTKKAVAKPEDLKGLKMRTFDRNTTELLTKLGIVPIQIAVPDVVPALASGALDATMTSFGTANSQKYGEFMKHAYETNHTWATNVMLVNRNAWNGLKPQHQQAIRDVAQKMESEFWQVSADEDPVMKAALQKAGMTIESAPPSVIKAMKEVSRPMWFEFAKNNGPQAQEILDAYLKKTGK